jgi:hypothetical protein
MDNEVDRPFGSKPSPTEPHRIGRTQSLCSQPFGQVVGEDQSATTFACYEFAGANGNATGLMVIADVPRRFRTA